MGFVTIGIIIIIQAVICGSLSMTLAEHKNYNSTNWFLIGFFFGIFGLIAAAGLPDSKIGYDALKEHSVRS